MEPFSSIFNEIYRFRSKEPEQNYIQKTRFHQKRHAVTEVLFPYPPKMTFLLNFGQWPKL